MSIRKWKTIPCKSNINYALLEFSAFLLAKDYPKSAAIRDEKLEEQKGEFQRCSDDVPYHGDERTERLESAPKLHQPKPDDDEDDGRYSLMQCVHGGDVHQDGGHSRAHDEHNTKVGDELEDQPRIGKERAMGCLDEVHLCVDEAFLFRPLWVTVLFIPLYFSQLPLLVHREPCLVAAVCYYLLFGRTQSLSV